MAPGLTQTWIRRVHHGSRGPLHLPRPSYVVQVSITVLIRAWFYCRHKDHWTMLNVPLFSIWVSEGACLPPGQAVAMPRSGLTPARKWAFQKRYVYSVDVSCGSGANSGGFTDKRFVKADFLGRSVALLKQLISLWGHSAFSFPPMKPVSSPCSNPRKEGCERILEYQCRQRGNFFPVVAGFEYVPWE